MAKLGKFRRLINVVGDPRWWIFYLQRRVTNPYWRGKIADFVARTKPSSLLPSDQDFVRSADLLNKSGFLEFGKILSSDQCREIREYFVKKRVYDSYDPGSRDLDASGEERRANAHVLHHYDVDVLKAPYLLSLANDERILSLAQRFLGCKPTLSYLSAWWSYPTKVGAQQAELFHRDVDDWRFLKLFIYLCDVDMDNGPHVYVKNSSSSDILMNIRRYSESEVENAFGSENIMLLERSEGAAFIENTYGFHRGLPVRSGRRLMFQAVYSMNPLPYGPKRPITARNESVQQGLDAYSNRVYFS